jgi:glycosyltransferase involved in cell wall biosynthesis
LPVIGCQGQGIADIIESGKNGILVPPRDIDALVAALEDLVTNPGRAREIGAEGRNLVFSHLTWEHNAQKVIALSRGLMQ